MKNAIVSLFALFVLVGCETNNYFNLQLPAASAPKTEVSDAGVSTAPDATSVSVLDTMAPNITPDAIVDTARPEVGIDVLVVSADAVSAETEIRSQDALPTDTTPVVSTDTQLADTAPMAIFKIESVSVKREDSFGVLAEDVRSFAIKFSSPAKNIWLTINEKTTGAIFRWDPIMWDASSVLSANVAPGNWTEKLKTSTTYIWSVKADAATPVAGPQSAVVVGEFVTAICFAGQTRSCYGGLPQTRNIGQCRDGTNACVVTSQGTYWNNNCIGETTPYPFGDRCGDGIDNDCDGLIDNSIQMDVPSGQDSIWARALVNGEVLRFSVNSKNASATHFSWLNVQVTRNGLNVGYYRLWVMNASGSWNDISSQVDFFDASSGGYKIGMFDLGSNLFTGPNDWFNLGIHWKDLVGPTLRGGEVINYMLVANVNPEFANKGGTVRHYAPHSDSSCSTEGGKTISVD